MRRRARRCVLLLLCALAACGQPAATSTPDEATDTPPRQRRIVTLSPQLAELVFAVGAGSQLVGVSAYTDYPPDAAALPVIGDAFNLDLERLLLLQPDLLLAWDKGTPGHVVDELRSSGYRVEIITTTSIADIPRALRQIGALTGRESAAEAAASDFSNGMLALAAEMSGRSPITVFYQADARPLYTISGAHYISEIIGLCGGVNVFADIGELAPLISFEAVLERNPEVILASSDAGEAAFAEWRRWPELAANIYDNHFLIPADEIGRATPRLRQGAKAVCAALDTGRAHREQRHND